MIYAAIYPEKFEGDKGSKLMQVNSKLLLFSGCIVDKKSDLHVIIVVVKHLCL